MTSSQLEVGNGGMSTDEYKIHFSLWCIAKAPLLIGCDLNNISPDTLSILTNVEAIAVNQDALGKQGNLVVQNSQYHVWTGGILHEFYEKIHTKNLKKSSKNFRVQNFS